MRNYIGTKPLTSALRVRGGAKERYNFASPKDGELITKRLIWLGQNLELDNYFKRGEEFRDKEDYTSAIVCFKKALEIKPEHEDALFLFGVCCLQRGLELDEQQNKAERKTCLLKTVNANKKLLNIIGKKFKTKGPDEVIPYYYTYVYLGLGIVYAIYGRYADALFEFRRSLIIDATNSATLYNLAMLYEESDLQDDIIECYKLTVDIRPHNNEGWYWLGCIFSKKGMYKEAFGYYEEFLWRTDEDEKPELREKMFRAEMWVEEVFELMEEGYCDEDE